MGQLVPPLRLGGIFRTKTVLELIEANFKVRAVQVECS
jgi:hypothetical protein